MELILFVIHLVVCVSILALVLLQQGKGADMGAAFGSGASNTVFGSPGSASFLLKLTGFAALVFFATSIMLGYDAAKMSRQKAALENTILPQPVAPAPVSGDVTNKTPGALDIPLPQPSNGTS
ncbi:MAG: secG [Gammaproteobacteria bacterium]|jgi:preprotein translocase subunit SecG|nr:secG [Gammaproteobacteria bacterium]